MKRTLSTLAILLALSTLFSCASNPAPQFTEDGKANINITGEIIELSNNKTEFLLDTGLWVKTTKGTQLGIVSEFDEIPLHEQLIEPSFRIGNTIEAYSENPDAKTPIIHTIYLNWNWHAPIMETCEPIIEEGPDSIDEG